MPDGALYPADDGGWVPVHWILAEGAGRRRLGPCVRWMAADVALPPADDAGWMLSSAGIQRITAGGPLRLWRFNGFSQRKLKPKPNLQSLCAPMFSEEEGKKLNEERFEPKKEGGKKKSTPFSRILSVVPFCGVEGSRKEDQHSRGVGVALRNIVAPRQYFNTLAPLERHRFAADPRRLRQAVNAENADAASRERDDTSPRGRMDVRGKERSGSGSWIVDEEVTEGSMWKHARAKPEFQRNACRRTRERGGAARSKTARRWADNKRDVEREEKICGDGGRRCEESMTMMRVNRGGAIDDDGRAAWGALPALDAQDPQK
ncbi:hypothetical protein B0H16DRAFT_1448103 [Mycena metata]|uniref:Uncharacterized protein n=1 Tax=Mycena metata TaxID=1033252 RepID=A0AAD7NY21_9AGAR|nr:hypothetical protein B0H16DRAFT_1448103 [Mycena metata]